MNDATLNLPMVMGVTMAAAAFLEWTLAGIVMGSLYKPAAARAS